MLKLLQLQIKELLRSGFWQKSLWLNIVLAISGLYLLMNIAVLGYMSDTIIAKQFPGRDMVVTFTSLLLYFFLIDLLIRFIFVKVPVLSIRPFLTLPIKRSTLLHYPLIRSLTTFYNLVPVLLILPFFVKVIWHSYPGLFSITWLITIVCICLVNIFLNFSLKKYFLKQPLLILILLAIVGISLNFDLKGHYLLSGYFSEAVLRIASAPFFAIIPVTMVILTYLLGYTILKRGSGLEENTAIKIRDSSGFNFLTQFGQTGNLIRTEIRLIIRNQRPRSTLMFTLFIFFYAWTIYNKGQQAHFPAFMFVGFLLTAPLSITYGQYIYAWEGSYFDFYLANNVSILSYLESKYILLASGGILIFLITLPFAFLNSQIILINMVMLLYNTGITSIIILFICTFNTKSLDLSSTQFMNYQGMSLTQWLMVIPLFGGVALIFLVAWLLGNTEYSIWIFGITGFLGIIFHRALLSLIVKQFIRRKYKMASNFRQI